MHVALANIPTSGFEDGSCGTGAGGAGAGGLAPVVILQHSSAPRATTGGGGIKNRGAGVF